MIFKTIFVDVWHYSKTLFVFVMLFIFISLFYNFQFARLANLVDNRKPVTHPYAFEAFPFVVYNMYSGKINDWNKYSYLKLEADGQEVITTDLAIIHEDYFINPFQKFAGLKASNFYDEGLHTFLIYELASPEKAQKVYTKVSNHQFLKNEDLWGRWMKKYLSATLKREVKSVNYFECFYTYSTSGKPEWVEQKLVYHFE